MSRSEQYERVLDDMGVQYVYHDAVMIKDISTDRSRKNQARSMALRSSLVDEYAAAMRSDAEFPPLLGYRAVGHDRWVLIDGNHRLAAAIDVGATYVSLYDVSENSQGKLLEITYSWNQRTNGMRADPNDALAHAVYLVRQSGYRVVDAAKLMSLPPGRLTDALVSADTHDRLQKQGVFLRKPLSAAHARALAGIPTDAGLIAAVKAIESASLPAEDTVIMVRMITKERSEAGQIAAVRQYTTTPPYQARLKAVANGRGTRVSTTMNTKTQVMRNLRGAITRLEGKTLANLGWTDVDVEDVQAELVRVVRLVHGLRKVTVNERVV